MPLLFVPPCHHLDRLSILFTFAMGTAVGDGISEAWDIGYGPIFGFFAGVQSFIFLVWLALRLLGKAPQHSPTETLMFWVAYIWTRCVRGIARVDVWPGI